MRRAVTATGDDHLPLSPSVAPRPDATLAEYGAVVGWIWI
jgi:hypothetical protein